MRLLLSAGIALLLIGYAVAEEGEADSLWQEMLEENVEFNKTVTDEEIVAHFEFMLQHSPEDLATFQGQSPEQREDFLLEYRRVHNEAKIQIPTLRGLNTLELAQLNQIARWQAEQADLIEDADSRLREYSLDEYRTILEAAVDLVGDYDASIADHLGRVHVVSDFPEQMSFIRPDSIYVLPDECFVFLYNGIGRGIGYYVEVSDNGNASIAWFNEYDSWDRTTIDLSPRDAQDDD